MGCIISLFRQNTQSKEPDIDIPINDTIVRGSGTSSAEPLDERSMATSVPQEISAVDRPPYICETCWKGLFSAHLGLQERVQASRKNQLTSGGFVYTTTWVEIASRAAEGCRWCQLITATRDESSPDDPLRVVVGSQQCLGSSCTPKTTQDLSVFINDTLHFIGYLYATQDNPAAPHIVCRDRILDVGSERSLALAKQCLEDCIHTHKDCISSPDSAPLLPTRLIDCTDPLRPHLVATNGASGTYATLSYVWGEPQPHSTVISNLSAYMDFINPAHLPQTILDAIRTTHAIGLRYLWADTLCIIQDSIEDKLHEIARMRHIYRNAYVTIIAASARRVGEGFLQDRPAVPATEHSTFSRDITLPFICPQREVKGKAQTVGEVYLSPMWIYTDPPGQPLVQYDPGTEPVSVRGWCMQEYLMSPRSLVFAAHTLQFHCQATTLNIGGAYHDWMDEQKMPNVLFHSDTGTDAQPALKRGSEEWKEIREKWQTCVRNYTQRFITVPDDKLVVFGGLAEEFQRILCTDYLAGLWRDTLLADLLWNKGTDTHIPRPEEYRAPSWSWASIDGRVEAGAYDVQSGPDQHVAEVLRCEVTPKNTQVPFGEVAAGILVLRAPLVRCIWNIKKPNYLYRPGSLPNLNQLRDADDEDEVDVEMERIGIGYIDSEDDADVYGVWCVPLHWNHNHDLMGGLVVALTDSHHDWRRYRRIGFFKKHVNAGPIDWLKDVPLVEIEIV